MVIELRPAQPSDTDLARDAHHRAYREVVEQQYGRWVEAEQDHFFDKAWKGATFAIVVRDGVPCGYGCIEDLGDDIRVHELVVSPAHQGQGIGSAVLQGIIERARRRHIPVRLQTQQKNRAISLYRRLGFREIDRTETHILLEWNDVAT